VGDPRSAWPLAKHPRVGFDSSQTSSIKWGGGGM